MTSQRAQNGASAAEHDYGNNREQPEN